MTYHSSALAVDIIIRTESDSVVLIKRKNPPHGWALPGGFVDYGESLEEAAVREALEETTLHVSLQRQLHTYSAPGRDPRGHTVSTVYVAEAKGVPEGKDDASDAVVFPITDLPDGIVFDHAKILEDYRTRSDGYLD